MHFEIRNTLAHPLEAVYVALRDHLPDLVPHLENVDRIEVLTREEEAPGCWHVVNRWYARGSVPAFARPFVPARYLTWIDDARWIDEERECHWRFETAIPEVVQVAGVNRFRVAAGGTEILLSGDVHVDLARMRGVPRFLYGAAPRVAAFLVARVTPNLEELARAVDRHLRSSER